jgi:hypothetical protein
LLILTAVVGTISIFVSHTVAAVVLLPLVASILGPDDHHLEMMVFLFLILIIYIFICS